MTAGDILTKLQAAVQLHQQGRLDEAEAIYRGVLAVDPRNFDALQLLATAAAQRGRAPDAVDLYQRALAIAPDNAGVLANLGAVLVGLGRYQEAVSALERAALQAPDATFVLSNLGVALMRLGRANDALARFDAALATAPQSADIHANRSGALAALAQYAEAEAAASRALQLQPRLSPALAARGFARNCLSRFADALADFDVALTGNAADADVWVNRAVALIGLHRPRDAAESAARALGLNPDHPRALFQHGQALAQTGQAEAALASFSGALALDPHDLDARVARGALLASRGRREDALADYDAALRRDPRNASALAHRAAVCLELRRYDETLDLCRRAQEADPRQPFVAGLKWQALLHLGDWSELGAAREDVVTRIRNGEAELLPFSALLLSDPVLQAQAIGNWAKQTPGAADTLAASSGAGRPLRVGYFSADFRNHAVMALMAGVFEGHDRSLVEPLAFGLGPPARDAMRARAEAAFGRITDLGALDDEAALAMARQARLDVAIDLTGHTEHGRPGLFARRIAPVQVNYLGFTGTMGMAAYDYLLADQVCIPAGMREHYAESIVWLPHSYQPNDRKRTRATSRLTRAQCGLPEHAFVFCCFNNSYKITPEVFARWVAILVRASDAVLWLFADNDAAENNLRAAAVEAGLAAGRLIFARRTPSLEDHFSRYLLADLFLDTSPYNAHTTGSDALWSGLPVLTLPGETFAARVGASLLTAVGLPELIADTPEAYVERAIELATDRSRLAALKQRLAANRETCPLFDTERFTRHLEKALLALHARAAKGLAPAHVERFDT